MNTSLDQFRIWKTDRLRDYLKKRGLPSNKPRKELEALCYSAALMNLPEKFSIEEENEQKAKQYYSLLRQPNGLMLPDPLEIGGWQRESEAMKYWPKLFITDLTLYLLNPEDIDMGKRMLSDYKV